MIRLNCFIQVNEGKYDFVLEAARKLTEASLKQDGCIAYDIFTSATRRDVFLICETWADQKSLDMHAASDEFKKYSTAMRSEAKLKLERFEF